MAPTTRARLTRAAKGDIVDPKTPGLTRRTRTKAKPAPKLLNLPCKGTKRKRATTLEKEVTALPEIKKTSVGNDAMALTDRGLSVDAKPLPARHPVKKGRPRKVCILEERGLQAEIKEDSEQESKPLATKHVGEKPKDVIDLSTSRIHTIQRIQKQATGVTGSAYGFSRLNSSLKPTEKILETYMENDSYSGLQELQRRLCILDHFSLDEISDGANEREFLIGYFEGQTNERSKNDAETDILITDSNGESKSSHYREGLDAGQNHTEGDWRKIFTESARMHLSAADFLNSGCTINQQQVVLPEDFKFQKTRATYDVLTNTTTSRTVSITTGELPSKSPKVSQSRSNSSESLPCSTKFRQPFQDLEPRLPSFERLSATETTTEQRANDASIPLSPEPHTSTLGDLLLGVLGEHSEQSPNDEDAHSQAESYDPFADDEDEHIDSEPEPVLRLKGNIEVFPPQNSSQPPIESRWSQPPYLTIAPASRPTLPANNSSFANLSPTDLLFTLKSDSDSNRSPGLPPQISGTSHIHPNYPPVARDTPFHHLSGSGEPPKVNTYGTNLAPQSVAWADTMIPTPVMPPPMMPPPMMPPPMMPPPMMPPPMMPPPMMPSYIAPTWDLSTFSGQSYMLPHAQEGFGMEVYERNSGLEYGNDGFKSMQLFNSG